MSQLISASRGKQSKGSHTHKKKLFYLVAGPQEGRGAKSPEILLRKKNSMEKMDEIKSR